MAEITSSSVTSSNGAGKRGVALIHQNRTIAFTIAAHALIKLRLSVSFKGRKSMAISLPVEKNQSIYILRAGARRFPQICQLGQN